MRCGGIVDVQNNVHDISNLCREQEDGWNIAILQCVHTRQWKLHYAYLDRSIALHPHTVSAIALCSVHAREIQTTIVVPIAELPRYGQSER
jgi:hypothetical protein